jgi:hypothetical protein
MATTGFVRKTVQTQFTRSATVTDYAAFQLITNGSFILLPMDYNDRPVIIRRLNIMCPALPGNPTLGFHLFNSDPSAFITPADYGGIAVASSANAGIYEGRHTQAGVSQSGLSQYEFAQGASLNLGISSTQGAIFGLIETQAAIVAPPANITIRVRIIIEYAN